MRERALIAELLAPLATHKAARGLADDTAVWLPPLGRELVITHDTIACGVHYLRTDPPSDVAWKLLAVNLSDLAAKGATPAGVLLGLTLGGHEDEAWLRGFVSGLGRALTVFEVALFGGDTVRWDGAAVLGCTAIGHVEPGRALARAGARVGDELWVSGTLGEAGLGLQLAKGLAPTPNPSLKREGDPRARAVPLPARDGLGVGASAASRGDKHLLARYRRPDPRLALGRALPGLATACMDVSDGLLIDASRLAAASGTRVEIDLADVPVAGDAMAAVTAGDDYELLFTAPPGADVAALGTAKVPVTRIGRIVAGSGLRLLGPDGGIPVERLGWEH